MSPRPSSNDARALLPERPQISVALSPEQLADFAKTDPALPALIVKSRNDELRQEFTYAIVSLIGGVVAFLSIVVSFVFLVLHGFPKSAAGLLATGVLSLVGGFVRNRLRSSS